MVKELAEHYEAGEKLGSYPYEMLDENKWLAARHGLEGELVDLPEPRRWSPRKELGRRLYDRLREHAQDLGGARTSSRGSSTCSSAAPAPTASASSTRPTTTGRSCSGRSCEATGRPSRGVAGDVSSSPMASGPDLFVVCRSCGREVSPYITECPYCGNRLRKRAPKLERGGTPKPPKQPRRRPSLGRLKPGEIPGHPGRAAPVRDDRCSS